MGWFGHNIYDGDGTQTVHYNFLKWAKCGTEDQISEWLEYNKTIIPAEKIAIFQKNIDKVLKKMPKVKYWNEYAAIEWQMLLALFVDNKIPVPKLILEKGIDATYYLMQDDADEFDEPGKRRRCLKAFIKKAEDLKII